MNRIARCARLALGMTLAAATAAAEPARQPFEKAVRLPERPGEEIYAARLDGEVYRVTPWDYADLRLATDAAEVPYALEKATETTMRTVRQPVAGRIARLEEQAGNRLELVWEAETNAVAGVAGLRFDTPLRDFERRVTVTGEGPDGAKELVAEALIYDYTRFMDVRGTEVALPPNAFRRLRVLIQDITDEQASRFRQLSRTSREGKPESETENLSLERRPLRIDRVSAWRIEEVEQVSRDRLAPYPVDGFDVEEDAARKQTRVTIRTRREPLTALRLETDSRNFSRACELHARTDPAPGGSDWTPVARGTLSRFEFRSHSTNSLQLAFAEQRREAYRLVIHHGDNPPLRIAGVKAEGCVYRLVFLHAAGKPLALRYGLDTLKKPSYDAAAVLAAVRKGNAAVEVDLGPEVRHGSAPTGGINWKRLLNSRMFFIAVVAVVVAALGWGLYRTARQAGGSGA